jgi:hypothetical protein
MSTKNPQNIPKKYCCINCDYYTSNKKDYNKHIKTLKHINQQISTDCQHFIPKNLQTSSFECNKCKKKYKDRSGLWRHNKNCKEINNNNINVNISEIKNDELINYLMKENSELKKMIIDVCKNNNNIITNNNCNNKTFNLQVFLNETCKNAMNIMDFANSIQLKLTDLENIGELGYIEGISKIIIDNLKLLDVTERPVHCSDFKRDVLYVKDSDKWEKENNDFSKIKKVINYVTNKNINLIPEWKQTYPECTNINSSKSTKINKMIMEIMETDSSKNNKIIKNIAKEVVIDKN